LNPGTPPAQRNVPLRLGVVSYLNVQPLIWPIEKGLVETEAGKVEIIPAVPRQLASQLRGGDYHAAIVPVFEYLLNPVYTIVPGACIGTHGRVGSVILFSDCRLEDVRRIQLDQSSLTSVNLTRVIVAELGLKVEFCEGDDCRPVPEARLLIGDPAIAELGKHPYEYDLGLLWYELTGLPFVFAAWLAHPFARKVRLNKLLKNSREIGVNHLREVAEERAAEFGATPDFAYDYFRHNLTYSLTAQHLRGWRTFARLCEKHGLIEAAPALQMHEF
jgi:chorismate dehydratase